MTPNDLETLVIHELNEMKAENIIAIDVSQLSALMDTMVICSGNSNRHVKSIANKLVQACKRAGEQPMSVTGDPPSHWILVDLSSVVVHIMLPEKRDFYQLEKLWSIQPHEH